MTDSIKIKKEAFEYIIFKLIEWYKSVYKIDTDFLLNSSNDLSKLKTVKLHFFVSSVNSKDNGLLDVFNNFYALPLGHVESDIYNELSSLTRYSLTSSSIQIKQEYIDLLEGSFNDIEEKTKAKIDAAVITLMSNNSDLIKLSALDLVEISHIHFSWRYSFSIARLKDKYSEPIPSKLIQEETKYFSLNR